ncbi:MAG TPA: FliG C-terminal domain-containing protein [Pirellulales bacterium]|nr:FliG C-terminal domain-containing protein [Pirellulales bacterium]
MTNSEENLRSAAIVVLSLDDATAERVLDQLPAEDAARVRRFMVDLEAVDSEEERRTIDEFLRRRKSRKPTGVELDARLARRLQSDGPQATGPRADEDKPFRFLHEARGERITPFLAGEHPQTIAVVVSHLPDDRAAAVLASLDADLQADVIQRLIDLDQADPQVVRELESALESRMLEQALAERRRETGLEAVTRILDKAAPALRQTIMAKLSRQDRKLAERLRPQRFEFADLHAVDDETLSTIFAAAGAEISRLALAGADESLVERIVAPLRPSEAKSMRQMIEQLGPMRLSDVEEAQREVARIARQLALEGTIDLPNAGQVLAMV